MISESFKEEEQTMSINQWNEQEHNFPVHELGNPEVEQWGRYYPPVYPPIYPPFVIFPPLPPFIRPFPPFFFRW